MMTENNDAINYAVPVTRETQSKSFADRIMALVSGKSKEEVYGNLGKNISDEEFEKTMMTLNAPSDDAEEYRKEAANRANRHELAELQMFNYHLPKYNYERIKDMEIVSFQQGYEFALKRLDVVLGMAAKMNPTLPQFVELIKDYMNK